MMKKYIKNLSSGMPNVIQKLGISQEGNLNLNQAKPVSKQFNLEMLSFSIQVQRQLLLTSSTNNSKRHLAVVKDRAIWEEKKLYPRALPR